MPLYTVIDWKNKDDLQRLLTIFETDAGYAWNTALQYKYLLQFLDGNSTFTNRAPDFFFEVITSFRYSLLMQMARLFDESKDAIGMKKVLNILEQSKYRNILKAPLQKAKSEYDGYQDVILEIRELRDKVYAHNDKTIYKDWTGSTADPLDSFLWCRAEEILQWAKNILLEIRTLCGENVPLYFETRNDIGNLLI